MKKILPFKIENPWKAGFFTLFFTFIGIAATFITTSHLPLIKENSNSVAREFSCIESKSRLDSENKLCRDRLSVVLGSQDEERSPISTSSDFTDFVRDWDFVSDFYIPVGSQLLCPKNKAGRNYQRMYYKYDIVPKDAKLSLKLRMAEEPSAIGYEQRLVTGLADPQKIVSEFDVPTRSSQVVSFREASASGDLASLQKGTELTSPIKEGTVINVIYETKHKQGQFLTQTVHLEYLPAVEKYGVQKPDVSYDIELDDSDPSNLPLKLFVGSYIGGCLGILDWNLTY